MKTILFILLTLSFIACNKKGETTKPTKSAISESIYASGTIKSKNQYQAFATVTGIIEEVFVSEGDSLQVGTTILKISNKAQQLNLENAELAANFSDVSANQGKLNDAKQLIDNNHYGIKKLVLKWSWNKESLHSKIPPQIIILHL
jgi:HlyD family secretion protein